MDSIFDRLPLPTVSLRDILYPQRQACCQACRGYVLESSWCSVCDGKGVVPVVPEHRKAPSFG